MGTELANEASGAGERRRTAGTPGLLGWALYDWANSSFPTVITTFVFAAYFTRQVAVDAATGSAQWGNALSISGLFVAFGGPILGGIGDQAGRRKPWILAFTLLCVTATGMLWWVRPVPECALMALVLVVVATIASEFAAIFYNAMLPDLAPPDRLGRWSGWAWGLGYAGGLSCLVLSMLAFVRGEGAWIELDRSAAQHVRVTFLLVAGWYIVFSLPLFLVTPDVPSVNKSLGRAVRDGLRQFMDSVRHVRRYAPIVRFLIARMIYIDGLATVFAFGGVFAAGTFEMTEQQVISFGIALNVTAGLGAVSFAWVDDRIGGKRTILFSLAGLMVATTAMLLARSLVLFWVFGLLLGIFVGPVQAASRSLLARMAPPELCNEMFGLYAFSGKATSFLGPLVVGQLTWLFDSQRIGLSALLLFFAVGFLLMLGVPAATGNPGGGPQEARPDEP